MTCLAYKQYIHVEKNNERLFSVLIKDMSVLSGDEYQR